VKPFIVIVVFVILAMAVFSTGSSKKTTSIQERENASAIIARAEATIHDWEVFGVKKAELAPTAERTRLAVEALQKIGSDEPEYQKAQDTVTKIESVSKRYEKEALNAEAAALGRKLLQQRKLYASTLEDSYLKKGQDFTVRTEGRDATILRIQWVLIGRPFVYNAINDRELMLRWKMMGFQTVIFSDGYNNTWRQHIE
jgi:hypothetical protein